MTAKKTVHLVPHTHWDREWYFSTDQSQVLLSITFRHMLDQLEKHDSIPCFILDGQSVMLEDYLSVLPEEKSRVEALVKQGKLLIGPWYTQTDQCVVHGESQLRNLYYGHKDSEAFGAPMKIGYVPDSFGQSEQLPQLLQHFGIDKAVFWRGIWEGISPSTEFTWCSRDGSAVKTAVLEFGYSAFQGMKPMAAHIAAMKDQVDNPNWDQDRQHILMMGGHDQKPWQNETSAALSEASNNGEIEYRLSTLDDYFSDTASLFEISKPVTSEMLYGKYSRIHRGIYSTRYDIKKLNADIEHRIINHLEPMLTMGWSLRLSYPHGLMEQNWKRLMQCHAHDSIGGCNTDRVNQQIKTRLEAVDDNTSLLLELTCRQISEAIKASHKGEKLVLFNTLPEVRSELVECQAILPARSLMVFSCEGEALTHQLSNIEEVDINQVVQDPTTLGDDRFKPWYRLTFLLDAQNIPAMGYLTCYIIPARDDDSAHTTAVQAQPTIENEHLSVQVSDDGKVTIVNKQSGITFHDALMLVDGGDDGDNYDYSPPREDWFINSQNSPVEISSFSGTLESTITLNQTLTLPANLEERKGRQATVQQPVTLTLTLRKGSDHLRVKVELQNQVCDHRLQLYVKGGFTRGVSLADQPFGTIKRHNDQEAFSLWQEQNWTSAPAPIYPMQSMVSMSSEEQGIAVFTNGIREYEMPVTDPDKLAITLFRSVGFVGKPDLLYRPGRLSGLPDPSPDSQLLQSLNFELELFLHEGTKAEKGLTKRAKRYLTPLIYYHDGVVNRFMLNTPEITVPQSLSLFEIDSDLTVSAIKKAEHDDQVVVRLFNDSEKTASLGEIKNSGEASLANGMEEKTNPIPEAYTLNPQQFVTCLIRPGIFK